MRLLGALMLLLQPLILWTTEYAPWYGRYLELYPKITYRYQTYQTIDSPVRDLPYTSNDQMLDASLYSSYDRYALELEIFSAHTRAHTYFLDSLRLTARYQLTDDVIGDAFSSVAGVSLNQVFTKGLDDISFFHHGEVEGELFITVGIECAPQAFWVKRSYALLGLGAGDHGSPWLHALLALETKRSPSQKMAIYLEALMGCGDKNILKTTDFHGYGAIAHRSLDIKCSWEQYIADTHALWKIEGAYRLFAYNCPKNAFNLYLSIIYPFGL
jgi:hypothetical protein